MIRKRYVVFFVVFISAGQLPGFAQDQVLPEGFVYVKDIIPDIKIELRYFKDNNFVGKRINGYTRPKCILSGRATEALKRVQEELKPFGFGLKIYDAYRPQQAVDHFVHWAKDMSDTDMKSTYYPDLKKADLIRKGYIAAKSSHTRGSTVDITIISTSKETEERELDMGTCFDFFGPESRPSYPALTSSQRAHRMLLQVLMKKHGFEAYPYEWWHFTLKNEPYPETYFNFPIQ